MSTNNEGEPVDGVVWQMTQDVTKAYTIWRKKASGLPPRARLNFSTTNRAHLKKAAEVCLSLNVEADDFMELAFTISPNTGGPLPNMLHSEKLVEKIRTVLQERNYELVRLDPDGQPVTVKVSELEHHLMYLIHTSAALVERLSKQEGITESNVEWVLHPVSQVKPLIAALLSHGHTRVFEQVKTQAREALDSNPKTKTALLRLGFAPAIGAIYD